MNKLKGFCLAAAAMLAASAPAHAQFCAQAPMVLPYLNGPPTWFDPGSGATVEWRPQLDDPRWASAPLIHLCNNTDLSLCASGSDQAEFRVLLDGTDLYVAVYNLVDDGLTTSDAVLIAVADKATGVGARAARIRLNSANTIAAPPSGTIVDSPRPSTITDAITWSAIDADGAVAADWTQVTGIGDPLPTAPDDWFVKAAAWPKPSGTDGWGMTVKVDLTKFGYSGGFTSNIKLFVGTRHTPTTGSAIFVPTLPGSIEKVGGATVTSIPADSAKWSVFTPAAAGCTSGINIGRNNVGVVDSSGNLTSTITACKSGNTTAPCPGAVNRFRAEPQNVPSGTASTSHGIRARFRLANWGSTIDHTNAPFKDIPGSEPASFAAASGCPGVAGWCWNNTGPKIDYQCSVASGDLYCPVLSNVTATNKHHCMLVQLDSPPGGANLTFETSAVYKNMNFAGLSSYSEEATVSIEGLQALTGAAQDRDVYLYVQRHNMPAQQEKGMTLPKDAMQAVLKYAQSPPPAPVVKDPKSAEGKQRMAEMGGRFQKFQPKSTQDAVAAVTSPPETNPLSVPTLGDERAMELVWPTYKVYAYYETGEKTDVEGTQVPVLAHMVPFGMYLDHTGVFYGFKDAIAGAAGVVLQAIAGAPNWYKVRIPNEGSIKLQVSIEALEKPPVKPCADGTDPPCAKQVTPCPDGTNPPCSPAIPSWVWFGLLVLVILLLAWLFWKARSNK